MEGHVAWGRLHRHLDSERTRAKQAEARLRQHLQSLEHTCLHRLRLLSWEQRQLRRERERLQQKALSPGKVTFRAPGARTRTYDKERGDTAQPVTLSSPQADIQSKGPSSFGSGFRQRPGQAALRPAQGGRRGAPRSSGLRAPAATNPTQGARKNGSQEPPARHTGLKDPVESREPSPAQSSPASDVTEEKPADRAASAEPAHPDSGAGPAGDRGGARDEEARPGDATPQPDHSTGAPTSPRATGREGNPNGVSSASSFPRLFARAANARYLRHRVPPESERELSLAEIFGHGGPAAQGRAASQSPPL